MYGLYPLASGSKGNCILLCTENSKILIDAGLSGKAIIEKLQTLNISIDEIDAILISHEHNDHISGLRTLAFRHGIPVLANEETAKGIVNFYNKCPQFKIFSTGETFEFKGMEIHPFSVQHDTVDPVMFTIKFNNLKVGICTDLGFVTSLVRNQLQGCNYLYVESNHEPDMVHASPRPMVYKQRVLGRCGHLSNEACATLLAEVAHADLEKVYLAHLSSECNHPDVALNRVHDGLAKYGIHLNLDIAYQDKISNHCNFITK